MPDNPVLYQIGNISMVFFGYEYQNNIIVCMYCKSQYGDKKDDNNNEKKVMVIVKACRKQTTC